MAHIAYKLDDGYPAYPYVVSSFFEEIFCGRELQPLYEQCRREIKEARNKMVCDEVARYLELRAQDPQPVTGSNRDNYR